MAEDSKGERSFEVSTDIEADAGKVWKAVSESEEISKWFAPEVKVTPGVGGSITVSWGPGMEGTIAIEAWEEGRHARWAEDRDQPYSGGKDDQVRHLATDFFIEDVGGGATRLRIVQSGFGPGAIWDNDLESTHRGWITFLRILKHNVERHWGEPAVNLSVNVYSPHPPEMAWDRLWNGLVEGGGQLPQGPGSPYQVRTAAGLHMAGECQLFGFRHFSGTIENWNNALCGLLMETHKLGSATYLMLTLYSTPPERVEAIQKQCFDELTRILEGVSGL
jgi:uncharacterized protein YndB with AHSA1/START domain